MTATSAPEGDALRLAAADLAARFPDLSVAVRAQLHALARGYDLRLFTAQQRARQAEQQRLASLDTRGRWMRRKTSNAGPGVPGLGHVSVSAHGTAVNAAEAVCGARLRGRLQWADSARADEPAPDGWTDCLRCREALAQPGRGAA